MEIKWRQRKCRGDKIKIIILTQRTFVKKTETYDIDTLRATTIIFYNGSKS